MQTKLCGKCKQEKQLSCFHKRMNGVQPNCSDCQNALNRARYQGNKKSHIAYVRINKRNRYQKFINWKNTLSCIVCGETYRKCLHFHHLDPAAKEFSISGIASELSVKRLSQELEKCVVLCGNCHVKVHDNVIVLTEEQKGNVAKFDIAPDS